MSAAANFFHLKYSLLINIAINIFKTFIYTHNCYVKTIFIYKNIIYIYACRGI